MSSQPKIPKGIIPNLRYDLPAGLVVFLVALPLCLGISLASQTPPITGLIAGIVGGLIVPLISRSPLSVSGPAAGLIGLVIASIESMGGIAGGGMEKFMLALFLSGVLQMAIGAFRLGTIALFFPSTVIRGMLAAIGIILISKQIPHALGYDHDYVGEMSFIQPDGETTFSEILKAVSHTSLLAIGISILSLAILILWDKLPLLKRLYFLPGALVVVVVGMVINEIFLGMDHSWGLGNDHLVDFPILKSFNDFKKEVSFPDWGAFGDPKVYFTAVALGIVSSLESLLSVEAVDRLDPYKRRSPLNRELFAQGLANSIAGMLGGLPVTAVIVRSSANVNSGGRTKTSAVFHAILLLLSLIFLAPIINRIPLAALAAILLMVGYKLAKPSLFKEMYRRGWSQFIPFIVTIIAVYRTDLLTGIGIGMVVGIFFVLKDNFRSALKLTHSGKKYLLSFRKDVSFLNKVKLVNSLAAVPEGVELTVDGKGVEFMDHDLKEVLLDFAATASDRNITIQSVHFDHILPQLKNIADGKETYNSPGGH